MRCRGAKFLKARVPNGGLPEPSRELKEQPPLSSGDRARAAAKARNAAAAAARRRQNPWMTTATSNATLCQTALFLQSPHRNPQHKCKTLLLFAAQFVVILSSKQLCA